MPETGILPLEDRIWGQEGGTEHSSKHGEGGACCPQVLGVLGEMVIVSVVLFLWVWQLSVYPSQVSFACCPRTWRSFNWKGMKTQLLCWAWPFAKNFKQRNLCRSLTSALLPDMPPLGAQAVRAATVVIAVPSALWCSNESWCFHHLLSLCSPALSRLPSSVPAMCSWSPQHREHLPEVSEHPVPAAGGPLCAQLPFWILRRERSL